MTIGHDDQLASSRTPCVDAGVEDGAPRVHDSQSHLTPSSPEGWRFWREFVVRGAGFPAAMVRAIASQQASCTADALIDAQAEETKVWAAALADIEWRVEKSLAEGLEDGSHSADLRLLRRTSGMLRRRRLRPEHALTLAQSELLRIAQAAVLELRTRYADSFQSARLALQLALAEFAADPALREAVAWQNHEIVGTVLDALRDASGPENAKRRQREDLLANYLQRYCTKNDTIGFFGPMAWARFEQRGEPSRITAGPGLVTCRRVFFEPWAIERIAHTMAKDPRMMPWLTPKPCPMLRLSGHALQFPGGAVVELSPNEAKVLSSCDGVRTVGELTQALLHGDDALDVASVHGILRRLAARGRVELDLALPTSDQHPERALRRKLDQISNTPLRQEQLQRLDALEHGRACVAAAAGDAPALVAALGSLAQLFLTTTEDEQARRNLGQAYGGRALVYEDCRRDADVKFSQDILSGIQTTLDLVLHSARWFTGEVAHANRQALDRVFDCLAGERTQRTSCDDQRTVDLPSFWLHAQSLFFGDPRQIAAVKERLALAWERIVSWTPGERRVQVEPDAIRDQVRDVFATLHLAWPSARYHCPDVLLVGRPRENADPLAVLGEIHVACNTLSTHGFLGVHPAPERILQARRHDCPGMRIVPHLSAESSGQPVRTQWISDPLVDVDVLFSRAARSARPEQSRDVSEFDVVRSGGELFARTLDGSWQCRLDELMGDFMTLSITNEFRMFSPRSHIPRITLGKLVVQRETWRHLIVDLDFALQEDDATRFLETRRFQRRFGWPRLVFVKAPWENKPFFVDFDSPVLVRILAKRVRAALLRPQDSGAELSVSEMLPDLSDLWLTDRAEQEYTSELRMVALHDDDLEQTTTSAGSLHV